METDCTAVYLGCVCCAIVLYHHRQAVFVQIIIQCVLPAIQATTVLFINSLISLFWIWNMGLRSSLGLWTDKSFGGLSLEVTDGEFNSSRCQASLGLSYCKWCWNTSSLSINLCGSGSHHVCSKQPAQAQPMRTDCFAGKQRPWEMAWLRLPVKPSLASNTHWSGARCSSRETNQELHGEMGRGCGRQMFCLHLPEE